MSNTPPIDKSSQGNARPTDSSPRRIVLVLTLVFHAILGAYCAPMGSLMLGVVVSQPILLATWAAFARQRFYYRLLWSLLLCTYLSFADDLGFLQQAKPTHAGETMVAHLALYVAVLVVLLLVRRFSRWRIIDSDGTGTESVYLAHHYGIHHMLLLTAIVALACSLVRSVLTLVDMGFPYSSVSDFLGTLVHLLFVGFPACIVPWITLTDHGNRFTFIVATIVGAIVETVLLVAYFEMLQITARTYFFEDVVARFCWTQIGTIISAVGTTLALRYCGFRMILEPRIKT